MAITLTTQKLQGLPTAVSGVYARIQSVTVKKYDNDGPYTRDGDGNETDTLDTDASGYVAAHFRIMYDVVLHANAGSRNTAREYPEWRSRLNSREIDHFTCTYDPTSDSNPYAQAYADLKTKLAAGGSPIASSIADA
jgi:hypothetical protein